MACKQESFPQTYLGLPLSAHKLNLSAFAPLIGKDDRYLAGWKSQLLSPAGRLVLVNAVLDSIPGYAMAAVALPAGVIRKIDARRHAFLWTGQDRTHGSQCLIA
jgi:hypothetical protein